MTVRPRPRAIVGAVVTVLAVGACAAPSSPAVPQGTAPQIQPAEVAPAPAPPPPPPPGPPCNATASTPPPDHMPTPGHMLPGSTMAAIAARHYLLAGVAQDTFGWGYRDPASQQIQGFDIDMVRAVARAIFGDDKHLRLVVVPNAQRIAALTAKPPAVDIVAETMTITCDRRQQVDFSAVYFDAGQEVLVPTTSPIQTDADLAGKRVCAAAGSTSLANLATRIHVDPPVVRIQARNQTDCLVLLQQGQVDAVSTDNTILTGMQGQDPALRMVGPVFSAEPYGMAIAKGHSDFTAFVNGVLAQLEADGGWRSSYQRWLAPDMPLARITPPVPHYVGGSS